MKIIGRYLLRIVIFLTAILFILNLHYDKLLNFFLTNQTLNSIIIFIIFIGIFYILRQLFLIKSELDWLSNVLKNSVGTKLSTRSPRLLKYLDTYINESSGKLIFTNSSMKIIMESLEGRIFESREISRYMIGLTIFLGLLGTFWGLLETINSVGSTVTTLDFSKDTQQLFELLKLGLEQPLSGMGTAFSSSLFGLSGSLILGFLDLQSNQAQNRFFNKVEETLSERTKFSFMSLDQNDKKNLAPAYIESLIEVTTENLKKSTSVIDKQNNHQEKLAKSISEINNLISENIELNKNISEEIRVLSKTIANVDKKQ